MQTRLWLKYFATYSHKQKVGPYGYSIDCTGHCTTPSGSCIYIDPRSVLVDTLTDISTKCRPLLGSCNDWYSIEYHSGSCSINGQHSVNMSADIYIDHTEHQYSADTSTDYRQHVNQVARCVDRVLANISIESRSIYDQQNRPRVPIRYMIPLFNAVCIGTMDKGTHQSILFFQVPLYQKTYYEQ